MENNDFAPAVQAGKEAPTLDTSGRVLRGWDPEEAERWSSKLAWSTLAITTYSMIVAFCVWFLVSAIAPKLNEIGFDLSPAQLYWLGAMPGLSGGLIRLVYMFLPAKIGTRKMVAWSSLLYVIPMLGWFFAVQNPNTSFAVLILLAFICGIGGGSFSGYMPSTGYFFPKRLSGTALGIQAGIGNLGMSIIQLAAPALMGFGLFGITFIAPQNSETGPLYVHNAAIFFVPWAVVAAVLAFVFLKDVPVKASVKEQLDIFDNPNTWYMTLLYVMTFGIFSGLCAQFGILVKNNFGGAGLALAFTGPLIGSVVRFIWGPLCDKFTGGLWTFVSGVGMTASLLFCSFFFDSQNFAMFYAGMVGMFICAGIGNAGTFKQMPMIMPKRQAGGAIGFTGAAAAFGPFLVGVALSLLSAKIFFIGCAIYCGICSIICWQRYARPSAPFRG